MLPTKMDFKTICSYLNTACQTDDTITFDKYIARFPDLEYKNEQGWTLLIMASFAHSYHIVKKLIDSGADVNASNNKGTTVLMYAKTKVKHNNNFSFLEFLIEKGANIHAQDVFGKTVLDYVKETKDEKLVKYFEQKLTAGIYGK